MSTSRYQFSLARFLLLGAVTPAIAMPFALWSWPIATFVLACLNIAVAVGVFLARQQRQATLFTATGLALLATLFFTDWAFSSLNPVVRVAWPWAVVAGVAQVMSVGYWLVSGSVAHPDPRDAATSQHSSMIDPTADETPRSRD